MIDVPLSVNGKNDNYDTILNIIYCPNKIVYYKSIKITTDIACLSEVIIDIIVKYYGLSVSIISD